MLNLLVFGCVMLPFQTIVFDDYLAQTVATVTI